MSHTYFYIHRDDSVKNLQDRFFARFPYLRINFFKNKTGEKKITDQSAVFCPETQMKDINRNLQEGGFEIGDDMTVSQLEKKFYDEFGLFAQVARKSGNVWMEPNMTLGWSVKLQNDHAMDISFGNNAPLFYKDVAYGC